MYDSRYFITKYKIQKQAVINNRIIYTNVILYVQLSSIPKGGYRILKVKPKQKPDTYTVTKKKNIKILIVWQTFIAIFYIYQIFFNYKEYIIFVLTVQVHSK